MPSALQIKPLGPIASAITSLFQSPPPKIRGVETSSWMGPLQPVKPVAPAGTEPRAWQYQPGANLVFTPRANEPVDFAQLRESAQYDMVRIVIENLKDELCRLVPIPRLKRRPGESTRDYAKRKPDQGILDALSDVINYPSGVRSDEAYQEFTRRILEDMLVIDATSILFRTTKSKDLVELRPIDGSTITRYIDEQGFTPQAPSAAYAQIIHGLPAVQLTTEQLLYSPRYVQNGRLYGCPPVEQMIHFIAFGRNRLEFQNNYYTDGTLPDALQIVPAGVQPDKIKEAQEWMNSELAGHLARRRQLRLMQGFTEDGKDQVIFPKEVLLTDGTDEMIFRALFYAFGQSATRVIPMMNRATSEQNSGEAEKQGLEPFSKWLKDSIWNRIIQRYLGFKDYEFTFQEDTDVDPLKQAQIDASDVNTGIVKRNEVRIARGLEEDPTPEANMLMVTGTVTPLNAEEEIKRAKAKAEAMPTPAPIGGGPPEPKESKTEKATLDTLNKIHDAVGRALEEDPAPLEKAAPAQPTINVSVTPTEATAATKLEIFEKVRQDVEAVTANATEQITAVKSEVAETRQQAGELAIVVQGHVEKAGKRIDETQQTLEQLRTQLTEVTKLATKKPDGRLLIKRDSEGRISEVLKDGVRSIFKRNDAGDVIEIETKTED